MNQHVDLEESSNAMLEVFPPEQYLGANGYELLNEVNSAENKAFNQEIEGLLNKFAGNRMAPYGG
jgi:hypothetical protein